MSVVIPVHNVEAFIADCIESVRAQRWKAIEIIVVDDGSPDSSGTIVDSLAMQDSRIRVIHQANEGVSSARNAGLELATGQYVCFVDGDDWISPYFIEHFVRLAIDEDADMVLGTSVLTRRVQEAPGAHHPRVWSSDYAASELLYGGIAIGCWNKLFRRAALDRYQLRFSTEFFMGEGLNFITMAAQVANRVVATNVPLYYYRRDNSRSVTTTVDLRKMENALQAIENIRRTLICDSQRLRDALAFHSAMAGFATLRAAYASRSTERNTQLLEECIGLTRSLSLRGILSASVPRSTKVKAFAIRFSPRLSAAAAARGTRPSRQ